MAVAHKPGGQHQPIETDNFHHHVVKKKIHNMLYKVKPHVKPKQTLTYGNTDTNMWLPQHVSCLLSNVFNTPIYFKAVTK